MSIFSYINEIASISIIMTIVVSVEDPKIYEWRNALAMLPPPTDHYCVFHQSDHNCAISANDCVLSQFNWSRLHISQQLSKMRTFAAEMSFLVSKPTFVSIITLRSIFGGDQLTDRRPCYLAFTSSMQCITFTL